MSECTLDFTQNGFVCTRCKRLKSACSLVPHTHDGRRVGGPQATRYQLKWLLECIRLQATQPEGTTLDSSPPPLPNNISGSARKPSAKKGDDSDEDGYETEGPRRGRSRTRTTSGQDGYTTDGDRQKENTGRKSGGGKKKQGGQTSRGRRGEQTDAEDSERGDEDEGWTGQTDAEDMEDDEDKRPAKRLRKARAGGNHTDREGESEDEDTPEAGLRRSTRQHVNRNKTNPATDKGKQRADSRRPLKQTASTAPLTDGLTQGIKIGPPKNKTRTPAGQSKMVIPDAMDEGM